MYNVTLCGSHTKLVDCVMECFSLLRSIAKYWRITFSTPKKEFYKYLVTARYFISSLLFIFNISKWWFSLFSSCTKISLKLGLSLPTRTATSFVTYPNVRTMTILVMLL